MQGAATYGIQRATGTLPEATQNCVRVPRRCILEASAPGVSVRRLAPLCTIAGDARGLAIAGFDSPETPALHGPDGAECIIGV